METDTVIVGGGLGGAALATVLARTGRNVLVLERETRFKDRVRGENMLPWGVAAARRLGVLDCLSAAGGLAVPFFNIYAMGTQTEHRPMPDTTPHREASLNMYHPDLQTAMLASAETAGARVTRGATVRDVSRSNGTWTVTFVEGDHTGSVAARLVVGADGRSSGLRGWARFDVERDPKLLRIAGTLVTGTAVPDDGVHLCLGPGVATFIAPLGNRRARMYFIYIGATGDRHLSGKEKGAAFLECCRSTGAPAEWFEGVEIAGPLAEFEGADQAVVSPAQTGLALIGDAAASTDPSWGCGLSKTMIDVEYLSKRLAETDDVDDALERFAADHRDYYGKLHNILSWMTQLIWTGGPAADERRGRVFARMQVDPMGFPDPSGQGPFGPSDEQARRLVLGEF